MQQAYDHRSEEAVIESRMHRGINIGNALEAPNEGEWGVYIQDEYFRKIREAGFDTVRIPIRWSNHAENYPPYEIYETFFNRIDHVVSKALEQNLTTIINIHHYEELMYDPAGHRDRFIALWRQISEHYKDYPETLYFELLNEPSYYLTDNIWNQLVNDTVKIIRETNPTRKIVIGPTSWNSIYKLEDLKLPDDDNIVVTFHFYTPFEFTHQGASWVSPSPPVGRKWMGTEAEKKQIMEELDIAFKWAMQHNNITLLMGEFGAYSRADMDSRVRWTYFVAREAEKRNIAWCYWEFCSGFGAYEPVRDEWREELLNALISEDFGDNYVSVDTAYGSFSGVGWYEKGSYATIRVEETTIGLVIRDVFDHFEGLGPKDRIIDERTVEVYVDGLREIKAVWRKDYTMLLLPVTCAGVFLIVVFFYKKRRHSG
ncbi:MAG: glycoside hydrolase family 5 protein [Thermoproteota archaeon]